MKRFLKSIIKSQAGNSLVLAIVGMGAVGATGVYLLNQSQDARKVVESVEAKSNESFFESMISIYLTNSMVCGNSFNIADLPTIDSNVTATYAGINSLIDKDGTTIIQEGGQYNSGSIEVIDIRLEAPMSPGLANGDLVIEFKRKSASIGAQSLAKRFPLKIHYDGSDPNSFYCYMDERNLMTEVLNRELIKVCNGQGDIGHNANVANPTEISQLFCRFAKHNYTLLFNGGTNVSCPPGQALRVENYDTTTRELRYECSSPHSNQLTLRGCSQGLKYNSGTNMFECFDLPAVINSTPTGNIGLGQNCSVQAIGQQVGFRCL